MSKSDLIPVFDGHNDLLLRLYNAEATGTGEPEVLFLEGTRGGHIDLPRSREGGFVGGMFAIFPPPLQMEDLSRSMRGASYQLALPPLLGLSDAQTSTLGMASILIRLERRSAGAFRICRTVAEIRSAMSEDAVAAVMHIEGAEAIDPRFVMLDILHAAGLRSLGLVWSRSNAFAHGVPFRFPSSPDTGEGLTDAGKDLVRRCNELGILIDLSHLNEKGFWDVAALSKAPLVATHSNAHALCPHARNLTDRQLDAIRDSDGMVGLNFATSFLRPDGTMNANTGLDTMAQHLDHLIEHVGEDRVGLGSDFDGALVPAEIGDVAGLPRLMEALRAHGYDDALLRKIGHENWLAALDRTFAA
ncbi:dipeptidase AC. Metallo peptidase. MEROPS family M19 [Faunimonas pinastri]|uniref:Dipeptidase AC. Metallo peptidase. MEROPS family M19 n=1 Tax=Faunimonas pinastri TaxID=1855383 RepID=A0A1H9P9I4_9HYPH|nr:dipeptidase [Faunimonas pinastri]SER44856.1 dipeptidase AC. Metallo peptidase. MEROPS family M19 [Faunimonas pinastri]